MPSWNATVERVPLGQNLTIHLREGVILSVVDKEGTPLTLRREDGEPTQLMRVAVFRVCLHRGWPPKVAWFVASRTRLVGVIEPWERLGEMVCSVLEELSEREV